MTKDRATIGLLASGVIAKHVKSLRSEGVTYEKHQFLVEFDLNRNAMVVTASFRSKPAEAYFIRALRTALRREGLSLKLLFIKAEIKK